MNTSSNSRRSVRAAIRSCFDRVHFSGFLIRAAVVTLLVTAVIISPGRQKAAQDVCSGQVGVAAGGVAAAGGVCFSQPKSDLLFLIDASGSIEKRGQTYNIMIEGLLRALRDPAVIPRDGSIGVQVVVFNESATVVVSLKDINSPADAQDVAHQVEDLKCADILNQTFPCPFGETFYSFAIRGSDIDANKARTLVPKPGVHRTMILCSDGQPDDLGAAIVAADQARLSATTAGIPFEFDVLLMGLNSTIGGAPNPEYLAARAAVDQLVFPKPVDDLPGATLTIEAGSCNQEGATFVGADCQRQSDEFSNAVRRLIRQGVTPQSIVVGTDADTAPGAAPSGDGPVSLRQAIESANCNGGSTNITFDAALKGKTIHLLSPLSISQPDVVIDGCDGPDCVPSITLDGGGQTSDGIIMRSNHITLRGLKIANFTNSGILSTPVCPSDYISRNLIRSITFENNPTAVLIADDKSAPRDGFNEQIKISHIIASRMAQPADKPQTALIDLGGDGPTPNDPGDPDEGPNTLLNFPDSLNVASGANGSVNISGTVSGATAPGAVVEIYSITKSHVASGKLFIDGVAFLAEATVGDNCPPINDLPSCTFTATGVPPSPTGNYTATVIDLFGNTSELMFRTDKPPAGPSASFTTPVDFGTVNFNSTPPTKNVVVTNNGNAPLQISNCRIARCAPNDADDTARFTISGCPAAGTSIRPGESVTIVVTFKTNACGPAKACLLVDSNDLLAPTITVTLTGSVTGNGTLAITGDTGAVGPVPARDQRRKPKKFKKLASKSFSLVNNGCDSLTLTFQSIKRVTDVAKCHITDANSDDSKLWVLTQVTASGSTIITVGPNATLSIAPGQTLNFRAGFNPGVPAVVNKNCPDGNLAAEDVLPDQVSSVLSIRSTGGNSTPATLTVPLTGLVTKEVKLIDPSSPGDPPLVKLCRNGDEFIVEFSVYDSNQNVTRATYQFMDSVNRIVGQVFDIGISEAIASRNLATGQSFTVVQRFTGASDNSQIVSVQVKVFDGDNTTDGATANKLTSGCSSSQSAPRVLLNSSPSARPRQ
ncbi:MAG TPA: choice-of-anchor D domain-containing protein [Blastocatellia bacterium]|nr:choice-of-anchor D domain-containing protein [Blastocatellia bacterium]